MTVAGSAAKFRTYEKQRAFARSTPSTKGASLSRWPLSHWRHWAVRRAGSNHSRGIYVGAAMIEVKLEESDRLDWALKTFKKKVVKAGILKDLRKKRHYVKPSEARQLKAAAARRRGRSSGRPSR